MKQYSLIRVFGRKEVKFWKRTWLMHRKFSWFFKIFPIGFPMALILIGVGHFFIVIISFLFELWLWMTNKDQFKANMLKLSL